MIRPKIAEYLLTYNMLVGIGLALSRCVCRMNSLANTYYCKTYSYLAWALSVAWVHSSIIKLGWFDKKFLGH